MKTAMMLLCALALCGACWCQEPAAAPAVDRKDPAAVAQAYLQAMTAGDVEAATALVLDRDGARGALLEFSKEMALERTGMGMGFGAMVREFELAPLKRDQQLEVVGKEDADGRVTVTARETQPRESTLILVKDAEGDWCIDFEATATKTTGAERSFILRQVQMRREAQARAGVEGAPRGPDYWRRRNALQQMAGRLMEMAEKAGQFPAADTWSNDLADFLLDPAAAEPPEDMGDKWGCALNAKIAGQPLPNDWRDRQSMVVLYETQDPAPNQSGDPNAAIEALPEDSDGILVVFADHNATTIPADMSVEAVVQSWQMYEACQRRVSVICRALLDYARAHEGRLPEAESWCDDIQAYIQPEDEGTEVFVCPGAVDLEYGYAMNADIAGIDIRQLRGHERYVLLLPSEQGVRNEVLNLPHKVEVGRHMPRWGGPEAGRMGVIVGLLNGTITEIAEGQPYPRPPE